VAGSTVIAAFLAERMADAGTQWSVGTFGAIAEFIRDPDELVGIVCTGGSAAAMTARGGIRITPPRETRLNACETAVGSGWSQRIALCLPRDRCAMGGRIAFTELGPDFDALRAADRGGILFDLGLGCLQVDVCIRSHDADLISRLQRLAGRSLFEPGNPAMGVILAANPHRVFISRVGRSEVYQPIPEPTGTSPSGPHTHVLPKLLKSRRTHSANEPVPVGLVPCAHLYPSHPLKDGMGRPRPFDLERHAAFQRMFHQFGDPELIALKNRVSAAVVAGEDPSSITVANDRFSHAGVRIAVRQLRASEGPSAKLAHGQPFTTARITTMPSRKTRKDRAGIECGSRVSTTPRIPHIKLEKPRRRFVPARTLQREKQLCWIGWRIVQRAIDHTHHVVAELLRGTKYFADRRKRACRRQLDPRSCRPESRPGAHRVSLFFYISVNAAVPYHDIGPLEVISTCFANGAAQISRHDRNHER
jgi:hypothetical protein